MKRMGYEGSTSQFTWLREGVVVKNPRKIWTGNPEHEQLDEEMKNHLRIERGIFEHLGSHPNIVPYLGPYDGGAIQLAEANRGTLQQYIDENDKQLGGSLRWKWVVQATEAIVHLHQRGVIHSDLRPDNYLVHSDPHSESLDLWLCDFGGSMCEELQLDGCHLPDDPFYDPQIIESIPATDIFSLGSIFYNILTGHWPFWSGPSPTGRERIEFAQQAYERFKAGEFPETAGIPGGELIKGCWHHRFASAQDVLDAAKMERAALDLE